MDEAGAQGSHRVRPEELWRPESCHPGGGASGPGTHVCVVCACAYAGVLCGCRCLRAPVHVRWADLCSSCFSFRPFLAARASFLTPIRVMSFFSRKALKKLISIWMNEMTWSRLGLSQGDPVAVSKCRQPG